MLFGTKRRATHHTGLHRPDSLVLGIVWYVRAAMEEFVYTVPGVIAYYRAVVFSRNRFSRANKLWLV